MLRHYLINLRRFIDLITNIESARRRRRLTISTTIHFSRVRGAMQTRGGSANTELWQHLGCLAASHLPSVSVFDGIHFHAPVPTSRREFLSAGLHSVSSTSVYGSKFLSKLEHFRVNDAHHVRMSYSPFSFLDGMTCANVFKIKKK